MSRTDAEARFEMLLDAIEPLSTATQRYVARTAFEALMDGSSIHIVLAYATVVAHWSSTERAGVAKYRKEATEWPPRGRIAELCHSRARMWALVARTIKREARAKRHGVKR